MTKSERFIVCALIGGFIAIAILCSFAVADHWAVQIRGDDGRGGTGILSGAIIHSDEQESYALTNYHLWTDTTLPIRRVRVGVPEDRWYPATLVGHDREVDVALLRFHPGKILPAVSVAQRDPVPGQTYRIWGYPGGVNRVQVRKGTPNGVTYRSGSIEFSFSTRSGDSGAAIIDSNGQLAAINWGGGRPGIGGFGRPASHIRRFLQRVMPIKKQQWCVGGRCTVPIPPQYPPTPAPTPAKRCDCDEDAIIAAIWSRIRTDSRFQGKDGKDGVPGPRGPPGNDGADGAGVEIAEIVRQVLAQIDYPNRRVILVNGANRAIIDDETYSASEPIIIDVQAVLNAR